jgi:catechol 2,3-dioxygenase-like lactoylglutathione lyase family enzyme
MGDWQQGAPRVGGLGDRRFARLGTIRGVATATCSCCGEAVEGAVQLHSHPEIKICYPCLDWLTTSRDKQVAAGGGGWKVIGIEPILAVADLERSVDHYTRLGFSITHQDETCAFAHRDDDLTVHLAQADGEASPKIGSLYMHVYDADQLADDWRKAGLPVVGPDDYDYDYGKREGSHTDPDGNLIRFGSPLRRPN